MFDLFKVILPALALMLAVQTASAEPDELSRTLINEPFSMMEWGCRETALKVDDWIKIISSRLANITARADCAYDWDTDRINIRIKLAYSPPNDESRLNRAELKKFMTSCYTITSSGKTYLTDFFSHGGFVTKNLNYTPELKQQLMGKFQISFVLLNPDITLAKEQDGKLVFFDIRDNRISE